MTGLRVLFMGAKDGVGTTSCAISTALAWRRESGRSVCLCDWDAAHRGDVGIGCGNIMLRTAAEVGAHLEHLTGRALEGYCRIGATGARISTSGAPGAGVTDSGQDVADGLGGIVRDAGEQGTDADPLIRVRALTTALMAAYDHIFWDAGSRLDPWIAATLPFVTHFVLVVRPEPTAIHAAARCLAAWRELFVPRHRIGIIYNQWEEGHTLTPDLARERLGIARLATCPFDRAAPAAWQRGVPLAASEPRHPVVTALLAALRECVAATEGTDTGGIDLRRWFGASWRDDAAVPTAESPSQGSTVDRLREELLDGLQQEIDRRRGAPDAAEPATPADRRTSMEQIVVALIDRLPPLLLVHVDRAALVQAVLDDAIGLGPLEPLLADPTVSEIMVNGRRQVWVERAGRIHPTPVQFASDAQLTRVIERIVAPVGRRIDESSPTVDARLADGSRVHVIIPPLAIDGPTITIRRFPATRLTIDDLRRGGSCDDATAALLQQLVCERRNIVVAGGTGTGKTTLLNILSGFIPAHERIVTIEDAAELQLGQPHVVRLEARPPNVEGHGAVPIRELVRNALRMRPDRVVVGECRGGEALDMLQAMNTGHDGSLTTLHANSPRDALARLETLVMFAGMELPSRAIREQIAGAIHYIVQLARGADGRRQVTQVARVAGLRDGEITLVGIGDPDTWGTRGADPETMRGADV